MDSIRYRGGVFVNCRIGSLEMDHVGNYLRHHGVNCRIGSLEMLDDAPYLPRIVNCRIGSLEMFAVSKDGKVSS